MSIDIRPDSRVGELAAENPSTIRVFQRRNIDFCCGGGRSLSSVSDEQGVPFDALRTELLAAVAAPASEEASFREAPAAERIQHILRRYHRTLREELPRLGGMMDRVVSAHGARHPDLVVAMAETLRAMRAELEPHMLKEEDAVFPSVLRLEALAAAGRLDVASREPIEDAIRSLVGEHELVGGLLRRMREVTGDFAPPEDACNTFRGLLHGLAELETDLHRHIHLENNVLFPTASHLLATAAVDSQN